MGRSVDSDPTNLDEARLFTDSYLIIEEDWGWRVSLICPVSLIKCDENTISELKDIVFDPEDDGYYFVRRQVGDLVWGSGQPLDTKLWVHQDWDRYKEDIEAILRGNTMVNKRRVRERGKWRSEL